MDLISKPRPTALALCPHMSKGLINLTVIKPLTCYCISSPDRI
jgi:hypothetical protein